MVAAAPTGRAAAVRRIAVAALLPALLAAPPAAGQQADAACDPGVEQALIDAAAWGIERDLEAIRDDTAGIRAPSSILDVSCLTDMFNYDRYDVFFTSGGLDDLLGLASRRLCAVADRAWRDNIGRPPGLHLLGGSRLPRVPGAVLHRRPGNILDDAGAATGRILR